MVVHVWTRHGRDCRFKERREYKQCKCPKWLYWHIGNKMFRQSATTRSWEKAEQKARAIELKHERAELGKKPVQAEPVTVEKAVKLFLADKRSQKLRPPTISKLETIFKKQLSTWCEENGVYFLADLDLPKLQGWRSSWKDEALAAKKKQERVRGFFHFCQANGWITSNPSLNLSRIKVDQKPTDYFTKAEYQKIVDATYVYDQQSVNAAEHKNNQTRLRTLTELMRWSGLSIRDAITLERSRLGDDDNLFLHRAKTGEAVFVPLPKDVAERLRRVPPGPKPNARYFFWSGNGEPKSAVADWQRAYRKLFKLADLKHADDKKKRCFPHMFRDTFAVEALLAGVPLEQVSILLGHKSVKTTEKHYAPFVKARQQQLVDTMKKAWAAMA